MAGDISPSSGVDGNHSGREPSCLGRCVHVVDIPIKASCLTSDYISRFVLIIMKVAVN